MKDDVLVSPCGLWIFLDLEEYFTIFLVPTALSETQLLNFSLYILNEQIPSI